MAQISKDPRQIASEAIAVFKTGNKDKYRRIIKKFKSITLTDEERIALLDIVRDLQEGREDLFPPHMEILNCLRENYTPLVGKIILEDFAAYPQGAKSSAIAVIAVNIDDTNFNWLQELLTQSIDEQELLLSFNLVDFFAGSIEFSGIDFLNLLELATAKGSCKALADNFRTIVKRHLENNWFPVERKKKFCEFANSRLSDCVKQLIALEKPVYGSWVYGEDYCAVRFETFDLIECLAELRDEKCKDVLRFASSSNDPKVRCLAGFALLQYDVPISGKAVCEWASFAENRTYVYEKLVELGKIELLTADLRTQQALAEADLVRWLTFPTELGTIPDEIEFLRKEAQTDAPPQETYYFRFRVHEPHWAAENGWMIGWSGPFPIAGTVMAHGSDTFSEFERN